MYFSTHHSLRPTHALPEKQQRLAFVDETLVFGAVRRQLDVAAMRIVPLLQVRRSSVRVQEASGAAVQFTGEHRFEVTVKVVHLQQKNNRIGLVSRVYLL